MKIILLSFLICVANAQLFKLGFNKDSVLSKPQGKRPNPVQYLDSLYVVSHLNKFSSGVSFLIPQHILEKFGRSVLGRLDGQFVMSKTEMDNLLAKTENTLSAIELELGIPPGLWHNQVILRIDVANTQNLRLRIPNGNETAANSLWLPGGLLPNGYAEAVIDPVPAGQYTETILLLK